MKIKNFLLLTLIVVVFFSCFLQDQSPARITLSLDFSRFTKAGSTDSVVPRAVTGIDSLRVSVYSAGTTDESNLIQTETFAADSTTVSMTLTAGTDLIIKIDALDSSGAVLYSGESEIFDLAGGEDKAINITMNVGKISITIDTYDTTNVATVKVTIYKAGTVDTANEIFSQEYAAATTTADIYLVPYTNMLVKIDALDSGGSVLFTDTSDLFDLSAAGTVTLTFTLTAVSVPATSYNYYTYIANYDAFDFISMCSFDPDAGTIDFTGSTTIGYTYCHGVGVHPNNQYAYISSFDNTATVVNNATISQSTGLLTLGTNSTTAEKPTSVVIHPTLDVAYVSSIPSVPPGYIWVHPINPDGTLGAGTAAPTASSWAHRAAIHPNGKFLYVANEDSTDQIQIFSINQTTGALTFDSSALCTLYSNPAVPGITVHPGGTFAYASYDDSASGNTTVVRWNVDPTTGVLSGETELFSEIGPPTNLYEAIDVGPEGKYLYVTNWRGQAIKVFTINQTTGEITFQQDYVPSDPAVYPHTNVAFSKIAVP